MKPVRWNSLLDINTVNDDLVVGEAKLLASAKCVISTPRYNKPPPLKKAFVGPHVADLLKEESLREMRKALSSKDKYLAEMLAKYVNGGNWVSPKEQAFSGINGQPRLRRLRTGGYGRLS
jgi:hypothetical protein